MAIDVSTLVKISRRWEARRQGVRRKRRPLATCPPAALLAPVSVENTLFVTDVLILSERTSAQGGALATSRYRR